MIEQVLALADDPLPRVQPFASWEATLTYVCAVVGREMLWDFGRFGRDQGPDFRAVDSRLKSLAHQHLRAVYGRPAAAIIVSTRVTSGAECGSSAVPQVVGWMGGNRTCGTDTL